MSETAEGYSEPLNYHVRRVALEFEGENWELTLIELNSGQGVSVALNQPGAPFGEQVLLDFREVVSDPRVARMHLFPGVNKEVDFEEKKRRMTSFQTATRILSSLMSQEPWPTDVDSVRDALDRNRIPTPQTVVLETTRPGLVGLFTALNYPSAPNGMGFHVPWTQLSADAHSGSYLQTWLDQKSAKYERLS